MDFNYILDCLIDFDTNLFLLGNGHHTPFLDSIMWFISGKLEWIPMYLILTYMLYKKFGLKTCMVLLLFVGSLIALADSTCSAVIRPAVCRMRPSCPDNPIYHLVNLVNDYHGRRYGFPSCHAANTVGLALFLSLIFKKRAITIWLLSWSVIVSYSRVYLGVHYPGDLFVGSLVGSAYAILLYLLFNRVKPRLSGKGSLSNTGSANHIFKLSNRFFSTLTHKFQSFLE